MTVESRPMNVELHLGIELHLDANLHNENGVHYDFKVCVHERDVDVPNRVIHSDYKAERKNEETRAKPRLSKYVKNNHPIAQIIRDKYARPMT